MRATAFPVVGDSRVRVSDGLALAAAGLTVVAVSPVRPALVVAVAAALALASGLATRGRGVVVLAGVLLFGAAVGVAVETGDVTAVLVGSFGAILAADAGVFAIGLDRDVDPSVATARVELLHAVGSVTVAVLTAGIGYAVYRSVPTGSVLAVVALLFGAVLLAALLRE